MNAFWVVVLFIETACVVLAAECFREMRETRRAWDDVAREQLRTWEMLRRPPPADLVERVAAADRRAARVSWWRRPFG